MFHDPSLTSSLSSLCSYYVQLASVDNTELIFHVKLFIDINQLTIKLASYININILLLTKYIYNGTLLVKSYIIICSASELLTIIIISHCDSRNIASSWIRCSITKPANGNWTCSRKNVTDNSNIRSINHIYSRAYLNCRVSMWNKRWQWYKWSFINVWWIT